MWTSCIQRAYGNDPRPTSRSTLARCDQRRPRSWTWWRCPLTFMSCQLTKDRDRQYQALFKTMMKLAISIQNISYSLFRTKIGNHSMHSVAPERARSGSATEISMWTATPCMTACKIIENEAIQCSSAFKKCMSLYLITNWIFHKTSLNATLMKSSILARFFQMYIVLIQAA